MEVGNLKTDVTMEMGGCTSISASKVIRYFWDCLWCMSKSKLYVYNYMDSLRWFEVICCNCKFLAACK